MTYLVPIKPFGNAPSVGAVQVILAFTGVALSCQPVHAIKPASYGHGRDRFRSVLLRSAVALVVVVLLAVIFVVVQISRGVPEAHAAVVLPATEDVAGTAPAMPWPTGGVAAALEVQGVGSLGGVRADETLPLASVAKLVTALVVLNQHPLAVGDEGPSIPVTPADVATYQADLSQNQSVLKVRAGEELTELDALEGLLIPSGNNAAYILATWSAGSVAAFVTDMNSEAATLGLDHSHFTDPSGLMSSTVGTASDMLVLASAAMANPVIRSIVAMPQANLPVAGLVYNFNYALGHDGIVGIKTGSTGEDGGNFVFAAQRTLDGRPLTVLGAVLGEQGVSPLQSALNEGESLASAAFSALRETTLLPAGTTVADVRSPWASTVAVQTSGALTGVAVPGEPIRLQVTLAPAVAGRGVRSVHAGETLATVTVSYAGGSSSVPATASAALSAPGIAWRLGRI